MRKFAVAAVMIVSTGPAYSQTPPLEKGSTMLAARADAERAQNEAETYANRVVPEARGRVAQITQAA